MGGFCSDFTPEVGTGQSGLQTVKRLNTKAADPMNLATIEDPEGVDAWAEVLYSSLTPIVTGGGQKKTKRRKKCSAGLDRQHRRWQFPDILWPFTTAPDCVRVRSG